jgi:predicted ATPase/DNA-binding CsgD family transcriptional regulator
MRHGPARGPKRLEGSRKPPFSPTPLLRGDHDFAGVPPRDLPAPVASLIGRRGELAAVLGLLRRDDARLVTLTGPAGVGKTRLALEVAKQILPDFPEGVVFVDLAQIGDPELVLFGIALALKIRESLDRPLLERLAQHLSHRTTLLVLDNFEQLLSAAPHLATLLAACPLLKLLATSRAPLHLSGEHEFPVPPLAYPDPARLPPMESLGTYPAVALFVERAQSARPEFALTAQNASSVAGICRRLDGLPLALELAAVRIKVLPPQGILGLLQRRLEVLNTGPVDVPPRQRTLSGAIGWSYDLLDATDKLLFQRLAVFAGGCSLEAATAICAADGRLPQVLERLASLIDKSLLRQETGSDGEARFAMLETIREYAVDRLAASGEHYIVQRRHAVYFLALAERAEPELQRPEQSAWLARLELEHDNLRAALGWCVEERTEPEIGLRLAAALTRFWEIRGYWSEGRRWLDAVLRDTEDASPAARVKALNGDGLLAFQQGDYRRAAALAEESLSLGRALGDVLGTATALNILGLGACVRGDYNQAAALGSESLNLCRGIPDPVGVADALHILGLVAYDSGDHQRAAALLEESLQLSRDINAKWRVAINLTDLGLVTRELRDYARAFALIEESLQRSQELGHKNGIAVAQSNLATVAWRQRRYDRVIALFADSLRLRRELGELRGIAVCLVGLAAAASATRQHERAARLFGAAEGLRGSIGVPLPRFLRAEYDGLVATTHRQVGHAFQSLWAEGRSMTADGSTDYGLSGTAAGAPAGGVSHMALTRRQQQVAALIAQGHTNREVAAALSITEKTAENHVQHILNKLSFRSRAQIAAWAVEHNLGPRF